MLEAWAEQSLVDRSSYPVRLTLAGKDLFPVAQAVTGQIDQIRMRLKGGIGEHAPIRFLVPNSASVAIFPRLLEVLQREIGPLQVSLMPGNFHEVMQRFGKGEADFALYYLCPEFMPRQTFSEDVSALIAHDVLLPVARDSKAARGAKAGQWRMVMLDDASYLGRVARLVMSHHNLDYRINVTGPQILTARQLALEGVGLAWLPASLVAEDLVSHRLTIVLPKLPPVPIETFVVRQPVMLNLAHEPVWRILREFAHSGRLMDFTRLVA